MRYVEVDEDDVAVARVLAAPSDAETLHGMCELARKACLMTHHQRRRGCSIPGCTFYAVRAVDDVA